MNERFVKETRIEASPADVWSFHESPGALNRLTPPWERVEVERDDRSLKPGSRVVMKTSLGPIPLRWVAEHTDYDPPHRFVDRQVSGPFAFWNHVHSFRADGSGTILRDEVEYRVPFGWLGRRLGGGLVRSKLRRMFDHRHAVTKQVVESGDFAGSAGS